MYYVYVIQSKKDRKWYTGSTNNLRKRFNEHNSGGEYFLLKIEADLSLFIMKLVLMNMMQAIEKDI